MSTSVTKSFVAQWLEAEEFRVATLLTGARFVAEAGLTEDEICRIQLFYGHQAKVLRSFQAMLQTFPALTLAIMVGHAGLSYAQGKYWESFWDELGIKQDHSLESAYRRAFRTLVSKFQLEPLPGLDGEYVQQMALHAGVPRTCLRDLKLVAESHLVSGRAATGAGLVEWLTAAGKGYRLRQLDVPIRNLVVHGGDWGLGIVDSIVRIVGSSFDPPGEGTIAGVAALPPVIADALANILNGDDGEHLSVRASGWHGRPTLSLSVEEAAVSVLLPYPPASPETPWLVTRNGETVEVLAEASWGVADAAQPPTALALFEPSMDVLVQHKPTDFMQSLTVIDSADPLLVFDTSGRLISALSALPRGVVYVMYPEDAYLEDETRGSRIEPALQLLSPWSGWVLAEVDTVDHDSLRVVRRRQTGASRSVRKLVSPKILPGPDVAGVFTLVGRRVYGSRPAVVLPANAAAEPDGWRVQARRYESSLWFVDETWYGQRTESHLDPFDGVEESLLGNFEIVVTGPMGTEQRATLFIADGLESAPRHEFRVPVGGGQTSTTVDLRAESPLIVEPQMLAFGLTEQAKLVEVSTGIRRFQLKVVPPAVEIRLDPIGKPARWRTSIVYVSPDDLAGYGILAARIPDATHVRFALRVDGTTLQEGLPKRIDVDVFQIPAATFLDTARQTNSCEIFAVVEFDDGEEFSVTLVKVQPIQLSKSVRLTGSELHFDELQPGMDLEAAVWPETAPWRAAAVLEIVESRAQLPRELIGAGPLLVDVFDAWSAAPQRPGPAHFRVSQPGSFADEDTDKADFSEFLSGSSAPINGVALEDVWLALASFPFGVRNRAALQRLTDLTEQVRAEPRAGLEALGNSTLNQAEMVSLFIRTRLVECGFAAEFTLNELHPNPWVGCLVEISDLPALFQNRAAVGEERAETLEYLERQGGEMLMNILSRGSVRELKDMLFDARFVELAAVSLASVRRAFASAWYVPAALLDADTRAVANADASEWRNQWNSQKYSRNYELTVRDSKREQPLSWVFGLARLALRDVDILKHPWAQLSLNSLVLAVVARLVAHGEFRESGLSDVDMSNWAKMAKLCPKLVMTDILIADALVTYSIYGDTVRGTK